MQPETEDKQTFPARWVWGKATAVRWRRRNRRNASSI